MLYNLLPTDWAHLPFRRFESKGLSVTPRVSKQMSEHLPVMAGQCLCMGSRPAVDTGVG